MLHAKCAGVDPTVVNTRGSLKYVSNVLFNVLKHLYVVLKVKIQYINVDFEGRTKNNMYVQYISY